MRPTALVVLVAAVVLLSGCAGGPGTPATDSPSDPTAGTATGNPSPTATPGPSPSTTAPPSPSPATAHNQTPHTGCQPGRIEKNGTCRPITEGSNADVFDASNLTAITGSNTTLGGTPGYLARPAADGEYPAVVVIHEWWGLNANIRHMADVLAGHGYVVFAVDLYGGRVATNASYAADLSSEVRNDPDAAVAKMGRAVDGLRALPYTTRKVASLGWCFGGGQSLRLSLSETHLNATVVYYGTLTTDPATLRHVDGPVLGIFGAEDRVVPVETVREFDRTLGELGIEREIYVYEGAPHAFANPSGEQFRPEATRDAWNRTLRFLAATLRD